MNRRRDDVRGRLVAELHDVLAEVSLGDLDAGAHQRIVEPDFLGGHRFPFDHPLHLVLLCYFEDVLARLRRIGGEEHDTAIGLELRLERDEVFIEVRDGVFLDPARLSATCSRWRPLAFSSLRRSSRSATPARLASKKSALLGTSVTLGTNQLMRSTWR